MANQLAVTLISSDNTFLTYPCFGMLEFFEISTIGTLSAGVFRQLINGKQDGGPVEVHNAVFSYDHMIALAVYRMGKDA